ncbi:MAG TPA: hypothetical protein VLH19_02375 [Patescibacteria group bacterium]|nr:hypothetical protein [Patescibacteria group bacterium]
MSYSRLETHERTTLIRQIVFFLGAGAGLILVFMLVVMPLSIQILARMHVSSKITVDNQSSVPPSKPFLEQPFNATNSAQISLRGVAQSGSKILLFQNNSQIQESTASDDGSFTFDNITLATDSNVFNAYAENEKGLRSTPSESITIAYITKAPSLAIDSPADGTVITASKQNPITIKGKTDPGSKILIQDQVTFVSSDGSFSGQVQLVQGVNAIVVKAINAATLETDQTLNLRYIP